MITQSKENMDKDVGYALYYNNNIIKRVRGLRKVIAAIVSLISQTCCRDIVKYLKFHTPVISLVYIRNFGDGNISFL